MLKLKCLQCGYSFEISKKEIAEHLGLYRFCFIGCGGQNKLITIDQLIIINNESMAKSNITKWFKEYGADYTIDLIKRYKNYYGIGKLYIEELQTRGINLKLDR